MLILSIKNAYRERKRTRDIPAITGDTYLRHNGRVGHAEIPDAVYSQSVVDHGHGIVMRTHLAGARLMILWAGILAHGAGPVLLAQIGILGARGQRMAVQSHVVLGHGTGIGEGQRDLDTFDEDRRVHRIAQIVAPNDRFREGVVTGETQLPCGQIRLLATVNRCAIDRLSEFVGIS